MKLATKIFVVIWVVLVTAFIVGQIIYNNYVANHLNQVINAFNQTQ